MANRSPRFGPSGPAGYRPAPSVTLRPNNLPVQRLPLIGRQRERGTVRALLLRDDVGLVTLTGPGGTGKTRLALAVAADLLADLDDGAYVVTLAPILDPELVPSTIAQAVGVREGAGRPLWDVLVDYLRDKRILLVLDNFEQIVSAAPLVVDLLAACPRLKVLVTSRAVLRVSGEHSVPVPPLAVPDRPLPTFERLTDYEAVRLFGERARAARPDFAVTEENAAVVAEICRRLDGLPLAIELAAARVRLLPPATLLARLERRLSLLVGGPRDLPARQQTLRDTLVWSHDLLTEDERAVFRRLAVFVGGCSLEAAEAVAGGSFGVSGFGEGPIAESTLSASERARGTDEPCSSPETPNPTPDTLDLLGSLVDKSLLRQVEGIEGEPRFWMLETLRELALEHLEASGEAEAVRRRHAEYFLTLAEAAESELRGPAQLRWLDRLEQEHDNLRAVLAWSQGADAGGGVAPAEIGLRLVGAVAWFWYIHGHLSEAERRAELALTGNVATSPRVRARGCVALGLAVQGQGDLARSADLVDTAMALYREAGDCWGVALTSSGRALTMLYQGEYDGAAALFEQSVALFRALGDRWGIGFALGLLGRVPLARGDVDQARVLLEESLRLKREAGDPWAIGATLPQLGDVALRQGDLGRATAIYEETRALSGELGWRRGLANAAYGMAQVARRRGDLTLAAASYRESLAVHWDLGVRTGIAEALEGLAGVAAEQGQAEWAARLLGAAEELRAATGAPLPPGSRADVERDVTAVRKALDDRAFATAWAAGRGLSTGQAVEAALHVIEPPGADSKPPGRPDMDTPPLTRREREVAGLIARGRSNRQIAEDLVIGTRTVEAHVTSILGKLGFSSRAQIAVWAYEHGLSAGPNRAAATEIA